MVTETMATTKMRRPMPSTMIQKTGRFTISFMVCSHGARLVSGGSRDGCHTIRRRGRSRAGLSGRAPRSRSLVRVVERLERRHVEPVALALVVDDHHLAPLGDGLVVARAADG